MANAIGNSATKFDITNIFDRNSQQFWNDVKIKFISKEKQDGLEMLEDIYSKLIIPRRKNYTKLLETLRVSCSIFKC